MKKGIITVLSLVAIAATLGVAYAWSPSSKSSCCSDGCSNGCPCCLLDCKACCGDDCAACCGDSCAAMCSAKANGEVVNVDAASTVGPTQCATSGKCCAKGAAAPKE